VLSIKAIAAIIEPTIPTFLHPNAFTRAPAMGPNRNTNFNKT